MEYQVFTTGDQIWTSIRDGKRVTVKLITHDGIAWEEGEDTFRHLTGTERFVHQVQVFFTRLILKALSA